MNVTTRIHIEPGDPFRHDVAAASSTDGPAYAAILLGPSLVLPAELLFTDPDDLERLSAECTAAANALREARTAVAV